MWSGGAISAMRKANIFLHELFTFQFGEGAAIVVPAGQGSIQQTGLTGLCFFPHTLLSMNFFVLTQDDLCLKIYFKVLWSVLCSSYHPAPVFTAGFEL